MISNEVPAVLARLSNTTGGAGGGLHWEITAKQLLAPLLHAAAVCGLGMEVVMRWVQYRDALTPSRFLPAHDRGQTVHQVRHRGT